MTLATLRFRRGTAASWTAANPILSLAEPAWESDTFRGKVGDGVTNYNTLPYVLGNTATATSYTVNVRDFGAVGDGVANDSTAFASAKTAASALKKAIYVPPGTYRLTSDFVLNWDDAALYSDGTGAVLNFTGSGLIIDGSTTWRFRTTLANFVINRAGTAGPALYFKGGGAGKGPTRWEAHNVRVESSTGDGLTIAGAYTGVFTGCYFRGAVGKGLNVIADPIVGTVFGNALTFVGCEIQGNGKAMEMTSCQVVTFVGGAIEGNTQGMELISNCRNVKFSNVYVEANGAAGGDYDLKVGTTVGATGLTIDGGFWNDGGVGKAQSVWLIRAVSVDIGEVQFAGFGSNSPILVAEATAGAVVGQALNNTTNGSVPITALGTCVTFKSKVLKGSAVLTYGALGTTASANLTITVTGAVVGDDCYAVPNGTPSAGILYTWWVSAADTVTVRATNITTGTITPTAITWRAQVTNGSLSGT